MNQIHKNIIKDNFSKAANNYNFNASIQNLAALRLVDLVLDSDIIDDYNKNILDIGCGTGFILDKLNNKFKFDKNRFFEIDISNQMLKNNDNKSFKIQADFDCFPFKQNKFDLVFSSFSLHWSENLHKTINSIAKIIRNGGYFAFTMPIKGSLKEIEEANNYSGCNFNLLEFKDDFYLKNLAKNSNFIQTLEGKQYFVENFTNGISAIKSIKTIGGSLGNSKNKKLINKANLLKFKNYHQDVLLRTKFTLTWSIIFMILKKND